MVVPAVGVAHMPCTARMRAEISGNGDMEFIMRSGIAMSMRMSRDFLASMLTLMSKLRKSSRMT